MEISPAAMDLLCGHSWPGNIRELDNVLKRVILMKGDGNTPLVPADFSLFLVGGTGTDGSFSVVVDRLAREMISGKKPIQSVERALLEKVIELCGGKVMDAARKTGTPKDRFYRLQDAQER